MNWSTVILLSGSLAVCVVGSTTTVTSCSGEFRDVESCTILSNIVIEGHTVESVTPTEQYNVTFRVKKVFKGVLPQAGGKGKFSPVTVGSFGVKEDRAGCISGPMKSNISYLLFLKDSDAASAKDGGYYRFMCSLPVLANKKNLKDVKSSSCPTCGKKPTVKFSPAKDLKVKLGEQGQLSCNHQGKPQPKINWFKDNKPLGLTNRIQQKSSRQSSKLIIKKATLEDTGSYECQGVNVLGVSTKAGVNIQVLPSKTTPSHRTPCADQRFCFHNGTCYEITALRRRFCSCLPEFKGNRCQEKFVPIQRLTEYSANFKFVLITGASVAGLIIATAFIVILVARISCCRKSHKPKATTQYRVREYLSTAVKYQCRNGPADVVDNPLLSDVTQLHHRQDASVQTDGFSSGTASDLDPINALTRRPNGKIQVHRPGPTTNNRTKNLGFEPTVSTSSSETSPSEIDSGEYIIQYPSSGAGTSTGTSVLRIGRADNNHSSPAKPSPGIWSMLLGRRTNRQGQGTPGVVALRTLDPAAKEPLLVQETTVL